MYGSCSVTLSELIRLLKISYFFYCSTNSTPHYLEMRKNVLQLISMTPGNGSFMNSNSLRITVFKKFQFARRNLGYWPTTYMIFDATTALFSLPFFYSHRFRSVYCNNYCATLIVWITNCFSSTSGKHPDIEPIAQQILFKPSNDHSLGSI